MTRQAGSVNSTAQLFEVHQRDGFQPGTCEASRTMHGSKTYQGERVGTELWLSLTFRLCAPLFPSRVLLSDWREGRAEPLRGRAPHWSTNFVGRPAFNMSL